MTAAITFSRIEWRGAGGASGKIESGFLCLLKGIPQRAAVDD
jgi:hypothetical protein